MKITINRKTFADALSEVAPFAPAKAPIAILKNAKITTKGNRMKIEANDTQASLVKYIDVIDCDIDGTFLINIAEMNKFVSKIKSDVIDIDVDGGTIIIRHPKGKAEFQTEDAAEFPVFKMPKDELKEIAFPASLLYEAVTNGRNFVSSESIRPIMCAIYAYLEDGEFGYCASDTHKLIYGHRVFDVQGISDIHWLIMPQVFTAIANACKSSDNVTLQITESHVAYRIGNTVIQTVQTKGIYPNFKRVIPSNNQFECIVEKSDIIDALSRIILFCDESQCTKIDITALDMSLSASNLTSAKSSVENLVHGGCNGNITIGVNVEHLMSSIGVFPSGEVVMKMESASRPIVFTQQGDDNLLSLTMPMQIVE